MRHSATMIIMAIQKLTRDGRTEMLVIWPLSARNAPKRIPLSLATNHIKLRKVKQMSERGYVYCSECDGEGRVYNNADPTSNQWVECECSHFMTLLESAKKVLGLVDAAAENNMTLSANAFAFNDLRKVVSKFS